MRAASRHYVGKGCALARLSDSVEERLRVQGYETQSVTRKDGWVIQGRKTGFLRGVVAADRAFTIIISGEPDSFTVSIGVGKWEQNLAVAFLEGVALAPVLLFLEIPVSLWSYEMEHEFWGYIEHQIETRG